MPNAQEIKHFLTNIDSVFKNERQMVQQAKTTIL